MEHLLHSEGIPPPAITLIGDSAGAHLALSLLLHLRYPNPRVSPVSMEGALSGAVLVSPWVMDMSSASDSMTANRRKDVLKTSALKYWARNFMGNATPDYWTSLLTVPAKWWADLLVDDILVIYGHDEVLRDDISELCEKITAGHGKATAINFLGEIHGHMLLNRFLRINKPCASERALRSWLDSRPSG